MNTPWGRADHVTTLPHGIKSVSTPSHGGYYVPPETRKLMPEAAQKTYTGPGWYEEDCDWALVILSFPDILDRNSEYTRPKEEILESARETVRKWHSPAVCAAFGLDPARESFYRGR